MALITKYQLGKDGSQVPRMAFGLMGLSSTHGAVESTEERLKVLDRAYELGETIWDAADVTRLEQCCVVNGNLVRGQIYQVSKDVVG